jgi:hypothetical protein
MMIVPQAIPVTIGLVAASIVISILEYFTEAFSLVPGWILFQPWTLVTAGLVEHSLPQVSLFHTI